MAAQEDLKKQVQENIKHINGSSHAPALNSITTSNIAAQGGDELTPPESGSPGLDNVTAQELLKKQAQENVAVVNGATKNPPAAGTYTKINVWSGPGPAAFDFRSMFFSIFGFSLLQDKLILTFSRRCSDYPNPLHARRDPKHNPPR
jgi:hypothetical protein